MVRPTATAQLERHVAQPFHGAAGGGFTLGEAEVVVEGAGRFHGRRGFQGDARTADLARRAEDFFAQPAAEGAAAAIRSLLLA